MRCTLFPLSGRYCSSGNKRCPVSGGSLKVTKSGKVVHTVDFALRKLIITQAAHAQVTACTPCTLSKELALAGAAAIVFPDLEAEIIA